jgi:hypothetical protein
MGHLFTEIFEILFEIIEFSEPYLLVTTIFFIPFTIMITSLPKRFFQYEFTQHLLPSLFAKYENNRDLLERINARTQMLMVVILLVDLFGLGHFFFGSHGGHEASAHHEAGAESGEHGSQHGGKAVGEHAPVEH